MPGICAFIFARGGSKGLPRKNILPLDGLPLFVHGIRIARQIKYIEKIFVSTDCSEISDIALSAGVEVIVRPPELATDNSPEWLSWKHAIEWVRELYGDFDIFLSLPPTAPLRKREDVENCLAALQPGVDAVITMTPAHRSPWFNMCVKGTSDYITLVNTDKKIQRRQDAPLCYDITTVAYAANVNFVRNSESIWDGNVVGVEVPIERSLDIDTAYDYSIAQFLAQN